MCFLQSCSFMTQSNLCRFLYYGTPSMLSGSHISAIVGAGIPISKLKRLQCQHFVNQVIQNIVMYNFTVSRMHKLSLRCIIWFVESIGSNAKKYFKFNPLFKPGLTNLHVISFQDYISLCAGGIGNHRSIMHVYIPPNV